MKTHAVVLAVALLGGCKDYYVLPGLEVVDPRIGSGSGSDAGAGGPAAGGPGAPSLPDATADVAPSCHPQPVGTSFCDDFDFAGERVGDRWDDGTTTYMRLDPLEPRSSPNALTVAFDDFASYDESYLQSKFTVSTPDVRVGVSLRRADAGVGSPIGVWLGGPEHVLFSPGANALVERAAVAILGSHALATPFPTGRWARLELLFHRAAGTVEARVDGVVVLPATKLALATVLTAATSWKLRIGAVDADTGASMHAQLDDVVVTGE